MVACPYEFVGAERDSMTEKNNFVSGRQIKARVEFEVLTSEKAFWQPSWSQTWGFSPVWVREWTVKALR
jgi:hypothetical protein